MRFWISYVLVLMSDSAIGFPNQVASCPWLKLDESSTGLPGRPSLETTPSLRQAWSTRISIRLQKGHDVFRSEAKWRGIRPSALFCYEKRWSISENIPIVVGTIPLLECIPVLSGKKSTRRRARLRFSHSDTNWSRKKGIFERKMLFSRHFEASPCNKSVIALVAR